MKLIKCNPQIYLMLMFIGASLTYYIYHKTPHAFSTPSLHKKKLLSNKPKKEQFIYPTLCSSSMKRTAAYKLTKFEEDSSLPMLYIFTPLHYKPEMVIELLLAGQTLLLVPRIHWLLVENAQNCSEIVTELLLRLGLSYTYTINSISNFDNFQNNLEFPKDVSSWIVPESNGVLYFFESENTIDIRLFEQIRNTKKVSIWPVSQTINHHVSVPIINKDENILKFFRGGFNNYEKFHVDLAGIALNLAYLRKQIKTLPKNLSNFEEFLQNIQISKQDIDLIAINDTGLLVWHSRSRKQYPLISVYGSTTPLKETNITEKMKYLELLIRVSELSKGKRKTSLKEKIKSLRTTIISLFVLQGRRRKGFRIVVS